LSNLSCQGRPANTLITHSFSSPRALARPTHCGAKQQTPARIAPRNTKNTERAPGVPETGLVVGGLRLVILRRMYPQRLSATDISALASMKNVAKCDTWCELQNPVNHRVFERKLRPKPLGRGHVCLGVTQKLPQPTSIHRGAVAGRRMASRRRALRLAQTRARGSPPSRSPVESRHKLPDAQDPPATSDPRASEHRPLPTRPQVRRGYPLSLSISISGGKETNKDSPSNGERTGNSPP
jgi:hypothetical protein